MLQRLYVHNFRCLENFEFKPGDEGSVLLIGKNGSGKSTFAHALKVFQQIGRGVNRVGQLVKPMDASLGRVAVPMRFELQLQLDGQIFDYALAFELPERFKEFRVLEERLAVDGVVLYTRELAQVTVRGKQAEAQFSIDWHLIALTVIQDPAAVTSLSRLRRWMANMVLLSPVPSRMVSEATDETLEPRQDASNMADWLAGLLAQHPSGYASIMSYMQGVMPDMSSFRFEREGKDVKSVLVRFQAGEATHELPFDALSDGEKCFFLCAVLLAANEAYGPVFAFWDEPDNHLSRHEISHFVLNLRRSFPSGQFLMTSHNDQAFSRFSRENTWVLGRRSHLEPTIIRLVADLPVNGDLNQAWLAGDLEP